MKNQSEWYAVPPYKVSENWKILNERGEIVAWFENKEDCIFAVKLFNEKNKTNGAVPKQGQKNW